MNLCKDFGVTILTLAGRLLRRCIVKREIENDAETGKSPHRLGIFSVLVIAGYCFPTLLRNLYRLPVKHY